MKPALSQSSEYRHDPLPTIFLWLVTVPTDFPEFADGGRSPQQQFLLSILISKVSRKTGLSGVCRFGPHHAWRSHCSIHGAMLYFFGRWLFCGWMCPFSTPLMNCAGRDRGAISSLQQI